MKPNAAKLIRDLTHSISRLDHVSICTRDLVIVIAAMDY